ncbi:WAT1-related protein At5g07050-like isoform X2 [Nicotiana tomentosiformis]|uniref:WAT1-related protein At5g07050-like isoform X2 n=1 Tax=Nicotiana tomentosiformis TaxID=4098 RepID=UPI00051BA99A|nr:WAT1-related protein At5g07050-like isoform X2 [Nicotiana tomentosiformis]
MENKAGCLSSFFQRAKPYIAMISLQFGYAGMNVITKVSLNGGMSHYVLVVYRHAFATAAIAPFALVLERKLRPKMTFMMFLQIFVLGLLGMEKVHIKKLRCQAKVVGTIVTVAGAMLMTLYKGHVINLVWSNNIHTNTSNVPEPNEATDKDWLKGSILLILATFAWASFFILQNVTMRKYTAPLSLTALVCFMGTLQSIAVTLVMEHKTSAWAIGFDMNLLAAAYAGIVSSSLAYYVQGLVMEKRGPVFVTAFSPLMMIIVAIMGSFILAEKIYLGGVLGAVLIVAGLYSVLWGKYKEYKEKEIEGAIPEPVKGVTENNQMMILEDREVNDIEMQSSAVAISVSMSQPPMLAKEAPKA